MNPAVVHPAAEILDPGCDAGLVRRYECPSSGRFYQAWAARDLFGQWCVVVAWGGIGSRRGQLRSIPHEDAAACYRALDTIEKRRVHRGYLRVSAAFCRS